MHNCPPTHSARVGALAQKLHTGRGFGVRHRGLSLTPPIAIKNYHPKQNSYPNTLDKFKHVHRPTGTLIIASDLHAVRGINLVVSRHAATLLSKCIGVRSSLVLTTHNPDCNERVVPTLLSCDARTGPK